jgi:DtxR family Mn-dependent transcriptional regulator
MLFNPTIFIILFAGGGLILAALFWPKRGLLARWKTWQKAVARQQVEDALKYLFNQQQEGRISSTDALSGALQLSGSEALDLITRMQVQGLLEQRQRDLVLSASGQRWALQIVRAHRLWERYLADEARMPLEQIHGEAHQREHGMTSEQVDALDAALGHPITDPHGDPIPNAQGTLRQRSENEMPLSVWKVGERGKITHLEDEPPVAYAQLLASGLQVGNTITLLESTPEKMVLMDGENELVIARAIAANVFMAPIVGAKSKRAGSIMLYELPNRALAEVIELDERCQGFTRRRFLDLGLTPGTRIYPELENAFREPRAYRLRGTLIALRKDQAAYIWVRPI